jgi:hypothetical protein
MQTKPFLYGNKDKNFLAAYSFGFSKIRNLLYKISIVDRKNQVMIFFLIIKIQNQYL